jgi:uncharacterized protein YcbK (DUF882 family)
MLGCSSLQNAVANGDTRTLSFIHTHRDDSITVTFKRNGRYDEDGLKKLNYFLRDWRNDQQTQMAAQLFDVLWEVSQDVDAKQPIHIVSSYRSPVTNAMLHRRSRGVAQFSQHMLGKAIDFFIPVVALEELRFAALRLQRGGVGFYPTSGSPFVHVDVGSVRHWPRMTHDQLVRVFPDGKTIHVPSDGHPLKNYQLALAEVQRRGGTPGGASMAAAQSAGIQVADAGTVTPQRGRNGLAKLLGIGGSDDEEETEQPGARPAKVAAATPTPTAVATRQETAAVPMPRVRPNRPGEYSLASAESSPAPTAADVVSARGTWQSNTPARPEAEERPVATEAKLQTVDPVPQWTPRDAAAPREAVARRETVAPREAVGPAGERLAWTTGAQVAPPRPPRDIEGTPAADTAPAETTATVTAWANNPGQNDRVPTDLALAYAAATHPEPTGTPAPMGSLRAATPAVAASAAAALVPAAQNATVASKKPAANPPAIKIGQRGNDPWLRGIVVTPSVHHSLSVNIFGAPDYRTLRPLMHKPRSAVAMVFSNDPTLGLTSVKFTGPAVAFLRTINDTTTRTAGLN